MTDAPIVQDSGPPIERPVLYGSFPRRIQAVLIDSLLIVLFLVAAASFAGSVPGPAGRWINIATLAVILLYEPVLVSTLGGTLGHRALNLRVTLAGSDGRLPFWRALVRWITKAGLGLFSFVFIAVTRRHQALHDVAAGATVRIRDAAKATPFHYAVERAAGPPARVSALRRVIVIAAYSGAALLAAAALSLPMVSERCELDGLCSSVENSRLTTLNLLWLVFTLWAVVEGWKGRLIGARSRRLEPVESESPTHAS